MNYSKKAIEKKFNCILDKNMAFDSGYKFWTAHKNDNGDIGEYLAETYTLKEMYDALSEM